jgi:hypothetical protein
MYKWNYSQFNNFASTALHKQLPLYAEKWLVNLKVWFTSNKVHEILKKQFLELQIILGRFVTELQ